jgi:TrmH family RNA methyltransferase
MPVGGLILVESSLAGNIGAAMRVAANFGVPRLDLVRPNVRADDDEVRRWACGGDQKLACQTWDDFAKAASHYRTLAASASGRGRQNLPVVTPSEAARTLAERGLGHVALVFGNETRGLSREDLDRCDLIIRIPTVVDFPVLNLAQSVAVLLGAMNSVEDPGTRAVPEPASQSEVDGLMRHLEASLSTIGFLDPQNPQRVLRQLRRFFGRAGITESEVSIMRGICRQMEWAAGARPGRFARGEPADEG